ncbi:helix-turn-helix domain-containing protein [Pseudomonas oryzihabitans]|uniref:helix-turn-helix domain-containing protein n=1 Tax=Pseudomonas oryzihabitans TaxID=47885 RepID=UPI0028967D67|nr:helix-turn-helix domain-containing protein [Pseudomonas oryzihabitans]
MTDKKKADQQASPKNPGVENTTNAAQRQRLLQQLRQGPVTTIEAQRDLNIMRPAARITELRKAGHPIQTHLRDMFDDQGRKHSRCAVYYLSSHGQVAA